MMHTPAHKQTDPAKQPAQRVNPLPESLAYKPAHGGYPGEVAHPKYGTKVSAAGHGLVEAPKITSVGGDGRTYVLFDEVSGIPVQRGAKRGDFWRDMHVISGGCAPRHAGSSGRVWTDRGEFFPSVVGLTWRPA